MYEKRLRLKKVTGAALSHAAVSNIGAELKRRYPK